MFRLRTLLVLFACLNFGIANAQQVRLDAVEGSASISGELLEFDGTTFKVNTPVGVFSINAATVICTGAGCPKLDELPSEFTIAGPSQTIGQLMADILTNYGEDSDGEVFQSISSDQVSEFSIVDFDGQEQAQIQLIARSSTQAIADLLEGRASIAVSDRRVTPEEEALFQQSGKGAFSASNNEQGLALDGLVAMVADSNPVRVISQNTLARVFAGEITNWSQLGGPDLPVELFLPDPGTASSQAFRTLIMSPNEKAVSPSAQMVDASEFVADYVQSNPNAIGIGKFSALRNAKALSIEGVCGLPIDASIFTIQSGEYPLVQPVYLYFSRQTVPLHGRKLLEYAQEDFVQSMVLDAGLVDKRVSAKSIGVHGQHLISAITDVSNPDTLVAVQRMFGNLSEADRLSTVFWFDTESDQLSPESEAKIALLVKFLNSIDTSTTEIQILGFTDRLEDSTERADLSRFRAETIRDGLVQQGREASWLPNIRTYGYASIAPLGCNDDVAGRSLNRRVEIWLRHARF